MVLDGLLCRTYQILAEKTVFQKVTTTTVDATSAIVTVSTIIAVAAIIATATIIAQNAINAGDAGGAMTTINAITNKMTLRAAHILFSRR